MNLYIRYFNQETLVHTADELLDFLYGIDEIKLTPELEADIRDYIASDVYYPKRYKVRPRIYFIIIKTEAKTMLDFKEKKAVKSGPKSKSSDAASSNLDRERFGWYEGVMDFKRVVMVPQTGKFQYRDTHFVARLKAHSGADCYRRIISHLQQRVDERSQFPSIKGRNFSFTYLGAAKNI